MYEIEKGLPIPDVIVKQKVTKWSFIKSMAIGDSFFVPQEEATATTRMTMAARFRKVGYVATYRQVEGGLRFWRVK